MKKIEMSFPELNYAMEEALNRLRVNIKFTGKHTHKILFTSAVPNEGKSFVTVNLFRMMAEAGFKTVYLDLDLRNSVVKTRHTLKTTDGSELVGLATYLSGMSEYEDVVYETNIENGYVLPCNTLLENPSALFEDPQFKLLLDRLAQDFRYVIIDSPPIINVADGVQIASMCDGAVMVVRSGYASKSLVKQSLQQLEQVGCKLLGVVLNRVPVGGKRYGYGKYYGKYGYGKYYGKQYGQYGYGPNEEK